MERLEGAGNDVVMPPESTDVPRSAWGTIDPEIRPKYPAPTFTKKSKKWYRVRDFNVKKFGLKLSFLQIFGEHDSSLRIQKLFLSTMLSDLLSVSILEQ
jgi:hypothetical protein